MNGTLKFMLAAATAAVGLGAFADAANTLIKFSTPGPDKYADGTVVLDNERYALAWAGDGEFDGFNADGTALNPEEQVLMIASLAKEGHCPLTVFQIDSAKAPKEGQFFVYLLDTRGPNGQLSETLSISGTYAAKEFAVTKEMANISAETADKTVDAEGVSKVKTSTGGLVLAEAQAPKITAIKVEGAKITLGVANLIPGLNYNVKGGLERETQVENLGFGKEIADSEGKANVVFESDKTNFFSIEAK